MPHGLESPWRSTSFRLALAQAGLLTFAMIAAATVGWWLSGAVIEREARGRVVTEVNAIAAEIRNEGLREAASAIAERDTTRGSLDYALIASDGSRLAGRLRSVPLTDGWTRLSDHHGTMLAYSQTTSLGARLTVAANTAEAQAVRLTILGPIFAAGLSALAGGLVISVWLTRRSLRRLDKLVLAVSSVREGTLSHRIADTAQDDIGHLSRQIDDMLERIERLVTTQRLASAAIAHELRTPLTVARHALEGRQLESADEAIELALRRLDAVLRLAELERGTARTRFRPINLGELVERVADAYSADAAEAGVKLDTVIEDHLQIMGDQDLLAQLLGNLLDNALQHAKAQQIGISVRAETRGVALTVTDDGIGLANSRPSEPMISGRGWGLKIVEAIAIAHGGRHYFPAVNVGTQVVIEIEPRLFHNELNFAPELSGCPQ